MIIKKHNFKPTSIKIFNDNTIIFDGKNSSVLIETIFIKEMIIQKDIFTSV